MFTHGRKHDHSGVNFRHFRVSQFCKTSVLVSHPHATMEEWKRQNKYSVAWSRQTLPHTENKVCIQKTIFAPGRYRFPHDCQKRLPVVTNTSSDERCNVLINWKTRGAFLRTSFLSQSQLTFSDITKGSK